MQSKDRCRSMNVKTWNIKNHQQQQKPWRKSLKSTVYVKRLQSMKQRQLLYSSALPVLRHRFAGAPREPSRAGRPSWHTYFVETTFRLRKRNRFGYMPSSLSTRTDRLRNDGRGAARRSTAAICARRAWACAMCKKSYPVPWEGGGGLMRCGCSEDVMR